MKNITFTKDKISLDIRFSLEDNTIWMTQNEIARLFQRSQQTISFHLKKLLDESLKNEPTSNSELLVHKRYLLTAIDGKTYETSLLSLEAVHQIGFKINPILTQEFYDWCLKQLQILNSKYIPIQSNIIRFSEGNVLLDVQVVPNEETVYLSQDQIATLFDTTIPNISMHIKNIYESGELEKGATLKDFLIVQTFLKTCFGVRSL